MIEPTMSKGKKKNDDILIEPVCTEPHVVTAQSFADNWVSRMLTVTHELQDVQQLLNAMSEKLESTQHEIEEVHTEAQLLSSLKTEELCSRRSNSQVKEKTNPSKSTDKKSTVGGGTPTKAPRTTSSLSVSTIVASEGFSSATLSSIDGFLRTLDDKKRQRLSTLLATLFRSSQQPSLPTLPTISATLTHTVAGLPSPLLDSPNHSNPTNQPPVMSCGVDSGEGGGTPLQVNTPAEAVVEEKPSGHKHSSSNSMAGAIPASQSQGNGPAAVEPRRPRDMPPVLWEEMLMLRNRRIQLEELTETVSRDLHQQLQRFSYLREMSVMANYGVRAAKNHVKRTMAEYVVPPSSTPQTPCGTDMLSRPLSSARNDSAKRKGRSAPR